jgi:hypothetical protein
VEEEQEMTGAPPDSDSSRAIVEHWTKAHDGPGWYYYDEECHDEGSVGAFSTREEAEAHARAADYVIAPQTEEQE